MAAPSRSGPAAESHGAEGIVWHHDDGRMAKIKARGFAV
jgi:hypothetical protein